MFNFLQRPNLTLDYLKRSTLVPIHDFCQWIAKTGILLLEFVHNSVARFGCVVVVCAQIDIANSPPNRTNTAIITTGL